MTMMDDSEFEVALRSAKAAAAAAAETESSNIINNNNNMINSNINSDNMNNNNRHHHSRSFSSPISECSDCYSDSDNAASSRADAANPMLSLAEKLTSQRWHEIGNGPHPIGATSEFEEMVDQLSSILCWRLRELLIHRLVTLRNKAMKNNPSNNGNHGNANNCAATAMEFLALDPHLGDYILSDSISNAIRNYVSAIGKMHNLVGFHSFEHATHVALSMNKLISMVTTVDDLNGSFKRRVSSQDSIHSTRRGSADSNASEPGLYDRQRAERISFGISEDPRLRFAMVFSALIHDVAHKGVPNSVLVEEEDELAIQHNDVSVAEQHSLQVAFSFLQREEFQELKRCIGPTDEERKLFRKTVIGMVMVTDISDQERLQIVACRWKEAFPPEEEDTKNKHNCEGIRRGSGSSHPDVKELQSHELKQAVERRRFSMFSSGAVAKEFVSERKLQRLGIRHSMDLSGMLIDAYPTTHQLQQHAVLDAMMNVADVAHTMQSFQVFVKWNKRLFKELYCAHLADRIKFDPSENWYENQIGFFRLVIIPLAQKMKTSGVFGATGTVFEYFALENRKRWMVEGMMISEVLIREVKEEIQMEQEQKLL